MPQDDPKERARRLIDERIARLLPIGAFEKHRVVDAIVDHCRFLFKVFRKERDRLFASYWLNSYIKRHPPIDLRQSYLPFPNVAPEEIYYRANDKVLTIPYRHALIEQVEIWIKEFTTANQLAVDIKNQRHIENLRYLKHLAARYGKDLTVGTLLDLDSADKHGELEAGKA